MSKLNPERSTTGLIDFIYAHDSDGNAVEGLDYSDFTVRRIEAGGTLETLTAEDVAVQGTYEAPTSASHIRIRNVPEEEWSAASSSSQDKGIGLYEVHYPNAWFTGTAKHFVLHFAASGMVSFPSQIAVNDLVSSIWDEDSADHVANGTLGNDLRRGVGLRRAKP